MLESLRKWATPPRQRLLWLALLTFLIVYFQNAPMIRQGFNLADESFLWYGARAILRGQVPIRDFMSYDPARYYWVAFIMWCVHGDGIIAMRIADIFLEFIAVFLTTALIARDLKFRNLPFILLVAVTATAWIAPIFKVADMMQTIILVAIFTWAADKPSVKRFLVLGIVTGFGAFIGRNHGIYGIFAGFLLLAYVWLDANRKEPLIKSFGAWVGGNFIGYLPGFAMLLIPGYAPQFWDAVMFVFRQGTTNIPQPVPWPWTPSPIPLNGALFAQRLSLGVFFVLVLAFAVGAPIGVFIARKKKFELPPIIVATAFLAIPYAHYAFSRADPTHMALGVYPVLIAILYGLSRTRAYIRYPLALITLGMSMIITAWFQPLLLPKVAPSMRWQDINIAGDALTVDWGTYQDCVMLEDLTSRYASHHQNILVVPFWPGAYPLLDRMSPISEIYVLFPQNEEFQQQQIEDIKKADPSLVVIYNLELDRRKDLLFSSTHPLVYQYIAKNYRKLNEKLADPRCIAFVRKNDPES
jgi:hypothetical protein